MSSALSSRHDPSSRTWWSSSKPPKYPGDQDPSAYLPEKPARSKSSNGKFNTLASAIGFKSKKHPSLAIQDPPPPMPTRTVVSTIVPDPTRSYTNRPPSKSVSSTRSQATSSEPRTPLDTQRDMRHQSLLTLSDADPFAAGTISVPRSPVDPGRLSVYSSSSNAEYSKRSDPVVNRGSYASTSSYSHSHGHGDYVSISRNPSTTSAGKKLLSKKSAGDLRRNGSASAVADRDVAWDNLPNAKGGKFGSVGPGITDKNRLSQPDASQVLRPHLRARGLTESGSIQAPNLFSEVKSLEKPRVVVRQASIQRMGMPPSAPPTHRLPTPPSVNIPIFSDADVHPDDSRGSSSPTYASSILSRDDYMPNQHYIPREDRPSYKDISSPLSESGHGTINLSSPKQSRTLKKSMSHQSLSKKSANASPSPLVASDSPEKAPRKQRSFHAPRIPMPPIPLPLRHTNSIGTAVISGEQPDKRGSTSSGTPQRKRLFSGSNFGRPATSSGVDDDNRSLFSLPGENERSRVDSLSKGFPPSSSFWDESNTPVPSSPPPMVHEYVPQHIMSPAEMLKIEASVRDAISTRSRQRGMSVVSSSTVGSDFSLGEGLAAPFSSLSPSSPYSRTLSNSQTTLTSISSTGFYSPPSTADSLHSLPPPPRRRKPPTPNAETGIIPLSPPPRTKVRRKPSTEVSLRRSSMMRKPSFLDIDDEDKERRRPNTAPTPPKAATPPDGSFLDFARESFESERSADDQP